MELVKKTSLDQEIDQLEKELQQKEKMIKKMSAVPYLFGGVIAVEMEKESLLLFKEQIDLLKRRKQDTATTIPFQTGEKKEKTVQKSDFLTDGPLLFKKKITREEIEKFEDGDITAWSNANSTFAKKENPQGDLEKLKDSFERRKLESAREYVQQVLKDLLTTKKVEEEPPFLYETPEKQKAKRQLSLQWSNVEKDLKRQNETFGQSYSNQIGTQKTCTEIYVFPPLFFEKASIGATKTFCFQGELPLSTNIPGSFIRKPSIEGLELKEATEKIASYLDELIVGHSSNVILSSCFEVKTAENFFANKTLVDQQLDSFSEKISKGDAQKLEIIQVNDAFQISDVFQENKQERRETTNDRLDMDSNKYYPAWFIQQFRTFVQKKVTERPNHGLVIVLPLPPSSIDEGAAGKAYQQLAESLGNIPRWDTDENVFKAVDIKKNTYNSVELNDSTSWLAAANLTAVIPIRVHFEDKKLSLLENVMKNMEMASRSPVAYDPIENALQGFRTIQVDKSLGTFPLCVVPLKEKQSREERQFLVSQNEYFFSAIGKVLNEAAQIAQKQNTLDSIKTIRKQISSGTLFLSPSVEFGEKAETPKMGPLVFDPFSPETTPDPTTPLGTKKKEKDEVNISSASTAEMVQRLSLVESVKAPVIECFSDAEFGSRFDSF